MTENEVDVDAGSKFHKDRPMGRKRAKDMKEKEKEKTNNIRLAAESFEGQSHKALKRHYEIMLFTQAPAGCDNSDSVEYFPIIPARALSGPRRETTFAAFSDTHEEEENDETNALPSS